MRALPHWWALISTISATQSEGLPKDLIEKVPIDGLSGKTDEDNLGFTYEMLDKYIREGVCEDPVKKALIDDKHKKNLFKLELMPAFQTNLPVKAGKQ